MWEQKEEIWLSPMTKSPTPILKRLFFLTDQAELGTFIIRILRRMK